LICNACGWFKYWGSYCRDACVRTSGSSCKLSVSVV
jgi:hypothetical protein